MGQFGWAYEAVNYDIRDDDSLRPVQHCVDGQRMYECPTQGARAGAEIVTEDGTRIAGWYIPAENGTGPGGRTVVLVHGRSANKSEYLRNAVPLHGAYNLLVIDLRNGGQSTGDETTLGPRERQDVAASIDWLVRTKHPTWIAGVGTSMGAASLLAAAVDDQRIRALVLDSMHATAVALFAAGISHETGHPPFPAGWATVTVASLRLGVDVSAVDPIRMIGRLGNRPVLLTHGTRDPFDRPAESAELNFKAAHDAGVPVELHYCEGAGHAETLVRCPGEWGEWVTTFLDAAS
jgi:pimeloyl-ACP methyl ester carboxylesterase